MDIEDVKTIFEEEIENYGFEGKVEISKILQPK